MSHSSDLNPSAGKSPSLHAISIKILTRIKRVFQAPFLMLGRVLHRRSKVDEIVVFSAPPAFFLWIVIATGFGLRSLIALGVSERAAAWLFIVTLLYFILAI